MPQEKRSSMSFRFSVVLVHVENSFISVLKKGLNIRYVCFVRYLRNPFKTRMWHSSMISVFSSSCFA